VLATRLAELRQAGVVELREPTGYALTARGRELLDLLAPLDAWAKSVSRR
jgi:DNA-binding HxlR family transcriptional regulator